LIADAIPLLAQEMERTIATEMVSYQTFRRLSLDMTFWLPQTEVALAQVEACDSPEGAVAKR
jgi:hypothetical protein